MDQGSLILNGERYGALIVPRCSTLPGWMLKEIQRLSAQADVIFVDKLTETAAEGGCAAGYTAGCRAVELDKLADTLRDEGKAQLTLSEKLPLVRFYHVSRDGEETYMFMNDDEWKDADFTVKLAGADFAVYDALNNTLARPAHTEAGVRVAIPAGGAVMLVSGVTEDITPVFYKDEGKVKPVECSYTVSKLDYGKTEYEPVTMEGLKDITA